jgi:hypothetical protein
MTDAARAATDWASARRRRWSTSRLVAAAALNLSVLWVLELAIDRVALPGHGPDRATTLVTVTLHAAPPPRHAPILPRAVSSARPRTSLSVRASAGAPGPVHPPAGAHEHSDQAITLPAPPRPEPPLAAASAPPADLKFLDDAAARQAIRAVAHGDTLASRGNALTREEPGSELLAADGSHAGMQRNLPAPPPAVALARGIDAAHKADCLKGDYPGGGMGLLSAPFLLAAQALGKCAHKL